MSSSRWSGFRRLHGRGPRLAAHMVPDRASVAEDLEVMDIAGALPFSIGPALGPMVLAARGGSYAFLSAVTGGCALASASAVLRVGQVR
jgi:hypothetical protein